MAETREDKLEAAILTCDELLRLTLAQLDAIAEDDLDNLNELLEERDHLISTLDLTAMDLGSDDQGGSSGTSKQWELLDKLRELLRLDEESREALQAQLTDVKARIGKVGQGRQLLDRYKSLKMPKEAMYIDRQR
jgi:hypothetical protein